MCIVFKYYHYNNVPFIHHNDISLLTSYIIFCNKANGSIHRPNYQTT